MKTFILLTLIIFSLAPASAYSTFGSPLELGNNTTTTVFIGGDLGELNMTGSAFIDGNTTSSWFKGILNWSYLTGFPSTCNSSEYISSLGDSIACAAISILESQISDLRNYIVNNSDDGYNLFADQINFTTLIQRTDGIEWIKPEHVFDIDDADVESDLNTYVDIAGDNMIGNLNTTKNITANIFKGDLEIDFLTGSSNTTIQDYVDSVQSAGRIYGGEISDNGDLTLTVAAGMGFIKTTDNQIGNTIFFKWDVNNSVSVSIDSSHTIYVDYNSGSPFIGIDSGSINHNTQISLGSALNSITDNDLHIISGGTPAFNLARLVHIRHREEGIERISGLVLGEPGGLNISITAGVLYAGLNRIPLSEFDTTNSAHNFTYYYGNGTGGWNTITEISVINNTHYDDGSGTLAEMLVNRYGAHWVYSCNDGHIHVVFGYDDYTLANAQSSQSPASLPILISDFATLIGRVIVQKGDTSFTEVSSAFEVVFTPSAATDHGELSGLTDDDHTQYLLIDGSRNMSENLFVAENITSSLFLGDGSLLTGVTGDNSSWNESYADTLYADISVTGDNSSWNETYADTLYADISVTGDNSSWNESYANIIYRLQSWNNLTGIPHATPSNGDVTHFSLADEIYDWVIGLGYVTNSVSNLANYYLKTEINSQGEVEAIWGVTLSTDTERTTGLAAQDACSEITGCVENAITDGNTNWDNSYGFIINTVSDLTNYYTKTIIDSLGNWSADKSSYWDTANDLDTVISNDEITELKIDFNTACAAGNHLYVSGNNLACEADDDTTYLGGNGISLVGTTFNFDGGASPAGDLGGTWAVPSVDDDSHAHIYSNIDAATSANWNTRVSDNTGTGAWVFGTSPTFTTEINISGATPYLYFGPGGYIYDNGTTLILGHN